MFRHSPGSSSMVSSGHACELMSYPRLRFGGVTHARSTIQAVLELKNRGLSASAIAGQLGVPRSTVRDWIVGRLPTVRMPEMYCLDFEGSFRNWTALPRSYVYLLGLYLGDGCISPHDRGVYKLRLTLDAAYPKIIAEAATSMECVLPSNKVNTYKVAISYVDVYSYSKA